GDETNERIDGLAGNDEIDGAGGEDVLFGGDNDDTLTGGADNDRLVGGDGTDTAVFSGNRSEYTIGFANGVFTIDGPDGSDTLESIENLQFDDGVFDLPSIATISTLQSSAEEGNADSVELTFEVTLDKAASSEQTISFVVSGSGLDQADADDFAASVLPSGTIVFAIGETSQIITIEVAGDLDAENDETFSVTLSNPSNALVIDTDTAIGTILSDDI
ncbi:unnamed protein product, partial [Ectocarpus sp. 12 AP-2014]